VPAGIFYPDKICVIGNGVVVDPAVLLGEIEHLEERGIEVRGRLFLSDRAHVLMPWHRLLDRLDEDMRGDAAVGSTGRGITPAFVDKVGRSGVRVADLVEPEALLAVLQMRVPYKNRLLEGVYGARPLAFDDIYNEYRDFGARLAPYVADTAEIVQKGVAAGDTVLLEGAQGALLDLDFGTYEYVTSSVPSSLAAGAALGVGVGPTQIKEVVGVFKAYNTRVGAGPMPTELFGETATLLREGGPRPEYGATTGRPRRCGWFDGVAARYSSRINGITAAVLTRLDVLGTLPTIKVCTAYRVGGRTIDTMPASTLGMASAEPVYEELPGWQADTAGCRRWEDLPAEAQAYVRFIQEILGATICIVSVGPERDQAINVKGVL
jgi:adenylosuccinate synthase